MGRHHRSGCLSTYRMVIAKIDIRERNEVRENINSNLPIKSHRKERDNLRGDSTAVRQCCDGHVFNDNQNQQIPSIREMVDECNLWDSPRNKDTRKCDKGIQVELNTFRNDLEVAIDEEVKESDAIIDNPNTECIIIDQKAFSALQEATRTVVTLTKPLEMLVQAILSKIFIIKLFDPGGLWLSY